MANVIVIDSDGNQVNIIQPVTSVVEIITAGPKGDTVLMNSGSFTGSFTGSFYGNGTGIYSGSFSGSTTSNLQDITNNGSITTNAITASGLFISGSNINSNGNVIITGSLTVSGSNTFTNIGPAKFTGSVDITGSGLLNNYSILTSNNTSSFVKNSQTSSMSVLSASYSNQSQNSVSSSYSTTASYALNGGGGANIDTGSLLTTASFNNFTASYNTGSFTGSFKGVFTGSLQGTSSWSNNSLTASYIVVAQTASYIATSSFANNSTSASFATTASYIVSSQTDSIQDNRLTGLELYTSSLNNKTGSFATTGSNFFNGNQIITGSLIVSSSNIDFSKSNNVTSSILKLINRLDETKSIDLASSTTVNIGTATGNYIHITGTTTITAFDNIQAGVERVLVFDGALTLTHNSSSLILPTGADITTAAGDAATFRSEGNGNWRCTNYEPASTGDWVSWNTTFTGFSVNPGVTTSKYILNGKTCTYQLVTTSGTSNATTLTFTLPFNSDGIHQDVCIVASGGTFAVGKYATVNNSNVVTVFATVGGGSFSSSGNKLVNVQITFEIA